jgi:hypothetical protein
MTLENAAGSSLSQIAQILSGSNSRAVEDLLATLPLTPEDQYSFNPKEPGVGWVNGNFHWVPVGRERGNAGRIKLANTPINPIAERAINGMEAIIELARQEELNQDKDAAPPSSPREAVLRYFGLPPLDQLPRAAWSDDARKKARDLARRLRVRLQRDRASGEFSVAIEDDGIGQCPADVHDTLLSLGSTTKADKHYLIGVFGQGGSSAYAVSIYSFVISRRAPALLGGASEGAGWTIVKHVFPKGRRDDYFAYLAADPDGRVPTLTAHEADSLSFVHGTRFVHIGYDFQKGGSAISRQMFPALNHVLYNPILPVELYAMRETADVVYGNGYRLSSLGTRNLAAAQLDKAFPPQPVSQ